MGGLGESARDCTAAGSLPKSDYLRRLVALTSAFQMCTAVGIVGGMVGTYVASQNAELVWTDCMKKRGSSKEPRASCRRRRRQDSPWQKPTEGVIQRRGRRRSGTRGRTKAGRRTGSPGGTGMETEGEALGGNVARRRNPGGSGRLVYEQSPADGREEQKLVR